MGANANREIFIFAVELTTSRIGNLTRSIHTLAINRCVTIHTWMYVYKVSTFSKVGINRVWLPILLVAR